MDSFKPLDRRCGWSAAQVGKYNRERFEERISAGWDLVIVGEAQRFGGSTDKVARFKLGQGLAEEAPYFLLLSATPHQGKTDAFHRLVSLIDSREFPDVCSVTREGVQPYVMRTKKRRAIDAEGKSLFRPRCTRLALISWEERHHDQRLLYEAVTEYVREGYNQAMREKRSYIGFLMILMQRLVVSSTSAIRTTLEKRLEVLTAHQEHRGRIAREREKADYAFAARRKTVERIGLPQVRNYRLNLLSQEERSFQEQLNQKAHAYPDMVPLLVIRVEGGSHE